MFHEIYDNVIGVDVASRKLDVYDTQRDNHCTIENDQATIRDLVKHVSKNGRASVRVLVVMEATGGYERELLEALHEANIDCVVANPLRVRQFAKGCGLLEKNDKIDAQIIAKFGAVVEPQLAEPMSVERKHLRALVHRREQVLSQQLAERNRLKQTADTRVQESIKSAISFYAQQLKTLDQQCRSCESV